MGKYGSFMSAVDICKAELEEMNEIMDEYDMIEEDKQTLRHMVTEAYYQLHRSLLSGIVLEKMYCEISNSDGIPLNKYMRYAKIEEEKHPFEIEDE